VAVSGAHGGGEVRRQVREGLLVAAPERVAPPPVLLHAAKLRQPEGGLQVGQVVLEAREADLVVLEPLVGVPLPRVLAHAVEAGDLDPGGDLVVRRRHHPPLARDDVLRHVEAEGGAVPHRPRAAPLVLRLHGVRRVLQDPDPARPGDRLQRGQVGRPPGEVHRDDDARAAGERPLDRGGVDVHGVPLAVDQHGARADVADGVRRRDEGHARDDDFVPGPDAERDQREVEPGGAGGDRQRVRDVEVAPELLLQAGDARAGADPAALEDRADLVHLLLADVRGAEDEKAVPDRRPAVDGEPFARAVLHRSSAGWGGSARCDPAPRPVLLSRAGREERAASTDPTARPAAAARCGAAPGARRASGGVAPCGSRRGTGPAARPGLP